ncbi:MAG TPA: TolC family protein [Puia sp.]|nr:TolC family protein [Puia sp.]
MAVKTFLYNFIFLGIFPGISLHAQDSSSAQGLTKWNLQNCIEYAKKNNIQISSLRLDIQTTQQDLLLSRAARQPNLYGTASQSFIHSKNTNPVVGGFQTQASFSSNYSLSSSWIIFSGGSINYDIRQKQLGVQSASLNVLQAENDITLQITQLYLNILLAQENIIYVEDLLATSQAQWAQGKQRFDAGSIPRKDLVVLEALTATDKYNLVVAKNTRRQNLLLLKHLLQLPTDSAFDVSVPDTVIATALVPSLNEVEKTALENRPEVKNSVLGLEIARLSLAKSKSAFLPIASVGGALSSGYSNNQSLAYLKQLDNNFYQQIGLTLSVPVFTRRVNKTNLENSKIGISQAELTLRNTKTTLSQTIEQAYINLLNAQAQYDASVEQLKANQESYRIASEQLKVGAVNMIDFLLQKNLYIQSLQAYVQAKYTSALDIKLYNFYMGVPVNF